MCKSVKMQNVAHPRTHAKCVRCACRFCMFAIMCAEVWMHKILHIHTRAKCAHGKCVRCAWRFCNWSLFPIMCAKVWMCKILHIHTRAKCVPFLSLLCYQLPKYRRANLLNYLHTSACSRDSRPRDWSRLGAIFMVAISPNISRDSRD